MTNVDIQYVLISRQPQQITEGNRLTETIVHASVSMSGLRQPSGNK